MSDQSSAYSFHWNDIVRYGVREHDKYSRFGLPLFRAPSLLGQFATFDRFIETLDFLERGGSGRPDADELHDQVQRHFIDHVVEPVRDRLTRGIWSSVGLRDGKWQRITPDAWRDIKGLNAHARLPLDNTAVTDFLRANLTLCGVRYFDIRVRPVHGLPFDDAAVAFAVPFAVAPFGEPHFRTWENALRYIRLPTNDTELRPALLHQLRQTLLSNLRAGRFIASRREFDDAGHSWRQVMAAELTDESQSNVHLTAAGPAPPLVVFDELARARLRRSDRKGRAFLDLGQDLHLWSIHWPDPLVVGNASEIEPVASPQQPIGSESSGPGSKPPASVKPTPKRKKERAPGPGRAGLPIWPLVIHDLIQRRIRKELALGERQTAFNTRETLIGDIVQAAELNGITLEENQLKKFLPKKAKSINDFFAEVLREPTEFTPDDNAVVSPPSNVGPFTFSEKKKLWGMFLRSDASQLPTGPDDIFDKQMSLWCKQFFGRELPLEVVSEAIRQVTYGRLSEVLPKQAYWLMSRGELQADDA